MKLDQILKGYKEEHIRYGVVAAEVAGRSVDVSKIRAQSTTALLRGFYGNFSIDRNSSHLLVIGRKTLK